MGFTLQHLLVALAIGMTGTQAAHAETFVFQAAGPTAASIQGTVDAYRTALGALNASNPGPLPGGRREINWDGNGSDVTTDPVTPFDFFLDSRGARFTTRGTGLSQAPPTGGPEGGLATLFDNPSYGTIFATFSPSRLFTSVDSNVTEALFFIPGTNGAEPASVTGFGAVFTDVDRPDGTGKKGGKRGSTRLQYFDADGKVLFSSSVPASPGDASLSFFGVVFDEALVGSVRITSGSKAPGPDDGRKADVVMMDDFIYGEPQPLP
ncbi:MAG: hypothetical protein ACREI8_07880 [Myxococcota bacterium]